MYYVEFYFVCIDIHILLRGGEINGADAGWDKNVLFLLCSL